MHNCFTVEIVNTFDWTTIASAQTLYIEHTSKLHHTKMAESRSVNPN